MVCASARWPEVVLRLRPLLQPRARQAVRGEVPLPPLGVQPATPGSGLRVENRRLSLQDENEMSFSGTLSLRRYSAIVSASNHVAGLQARWCCPLQERRAFGMGEAT